MGKMEKKEEKNLQKNNEKFFLIRNAITAEENLLQIRRKQKIRKKKKISFYHNHLILL